MSLRVARLEFEQTMMQGESETAVLVATPTAACEVDRQPSKLLTKWWVAFGASAVFVVGGHLLIKAGLNSVTASPATASIIARLLHVVLQPEVVIGLLVYSMGTVCWMRAVSEKEISF